MSSQTISSTKASNSPVKAAKLPVKRTQLVAKSPRVPRNIAKEKALLRKEFNDLFKGMDADGDQGYLISDVCGGGLDEVLQSLDKEFRENGGRSATTAASIAKKAMENAEQAMENAEQALKEAREELLFARRRERVMAVANRNGNYTMM